MLWLTMLMMLATDEAKPSTQTVDQLQTRITQLEKQLMEERQRAQIRLGTCNAALLANTGLMLVEPQAGKGK